MGRKHVFLIDYVIDPGFYWNFFNLSKTKTNMKNFLTFENLKKHSQWAVVEFKLIIKKILLFKGLLKDIFGNIMQVTKLFYRFFFF